MLLGISATPFHTFFMPFSDLIVGFSSWWFMRTVSMTVLGDIAETDLSQKKRPTMLSGHFPAGQCLIQDILGSALQNMNRQKVLKHDKQI